MSSDPHFFFQFFNVFLSSLSLPLKRRGGNLENPKKSFSFTSSLCYSETPSYPFLSFSFYVAMHLYRFFRKKRREGSQAGGGLSWLRLSFQYISPYDVLLIRYIIYQEAFCMYVPYICSAVCVHTYRVRKVNRLVQIKNQNLAFSQNR